LLPNGTYLVELNAFGRPAQSGAAYLTVAGAPVQGPGIALTPAASISVDVREEFTSTERQVSSFYNGVRTFQLRGPRAYLNVWLEPADDFGQHWGGGLRPPSSPSDDSMVIENVQPGRYWVRFSASRGYVAAATSGNGDLLHEPLAVSSGSYPVQVVMRDDTAELDGTVAGATKTAVNGGDGNPNTAAYIYCIPVPDSDGQFREFPASPDGSFAAAAMVPGAYGCLLLLVPIRRCHTEMPRPCAHTKPRDWS
jgi:hypothetical protein